MNGAPNSADVETQLVAPLTYQVGGAQTHAPMVEAVVAGTATKLIVDTGASDHLLMTWLVRQLGLSIRSGEPGTDAAGESVESHRVSGVSVDIDGWRPAASEFIVIDGPPKFAAWGIGGIISPQRLDQRCSVVLDLAGDRVVLLSASSTADGWLRTHYPVRRFVRVAREPGELLVIQSSVEPYEPVRTLVDTGAKHTTFAANAVPGLHGSGNHDAGTSVGGTQQSGREVRGQRLLVGNAAIALPRLLVAASINGQGGVLGMDILRGTVLGFGFFSTQFVLLPVDAN